ncbi:MAG: serine/threonine protein kinase [Planctomycetota bacterium]|nr:MAG: serine/threonine protein kinase [Planctomycetota bacterium]
MADPLLGQQLGKYRIEAKLGQGGMGAVYRGSDTQLERPVAIKILPKHLAAEPEFRERFLREAKKLAQLTHANVVQIYDFGSEGDYAYMAMQLLEGGSLQELLEERGRLPPREAARIVREAARGLARAHRAGVVHRDIKPANILLGDDGEVRLGDFGLVKQRGGDEQPLTQTGAVLGTPHYMAPEQCEGLPDIDGRADLYALGLVLYQCLSGVLPARGSTPLQIIHHRLSHDPEPLRRLAPDVPEPLLRLVEELLVRDREARLDDAGEVAERLDAFLRGAPGARGPSSAVAAPAPAPPGGDDTVPVLPTAARLPEAASPTLPDTASAPSAEPGRPPTGKLLSADAPASSAEPGRPPTGKLLDSGPGTPATPPPPRRTLLYVVLGLAVCAFLCFFCLVVSSATQGLSGGGF